MQKSLSDVWRSEGCAPLTAPEWKDTKQHLDENLIITDGQTSFANPECDGWPIFIYLFIYLVVG